MPRYPTRASDSPELTTEDTREPIHEGDRLFNYYDGKWGVVVKIEYDNWFEFKHDDGGRVWLNGVRVCTKEPVA